MNTEKLRFLNASQARAVDRMAIEEYGFPGLVLMENAARGCAEWMLQHLAFERVLIFCGRGNNGGDGLALGRHLANAGSRVQFILSSAPEKLSEDAQTHYEIGKRIGLPIEILPANSNQGVRALCDSIISRAKPEVVVDALLGTGARGTPRGHVAEIIAAINASGALVVAIDVPSGWDADQGGPTEVCIRAHTTLTMVGPKLGFDAPEYRAFVGRWEMIGIGIPSWIVERATR